MAGTSLPDKSKIKNIDANVSKAVSVTKQVASGLGTYSKYTQLLKDKTGIKLPSVSSNSLIGGVANLANKIADTYSSITAENTDEAGTNAFNTLIDNINPQPAAFKWVELQTTPGAFVSYDSVIIFTGAPLYRDNEIGKKFTPLGICQNFSMSSAVNITTIQELRCEEQLIIPGKTQPIQVQISRILGRWSNLIEALHNNKANKWNYSLQYDGARNLFGLYVMVLDTSRQSIVSQFYLERCAISNFGMNISAGTMQIYDNIGIIAGRIIDPSLVIDNQGVTQEDTTEIKENSEDKVVTIDGKDVVLKEEDPDNPGIWITEDGKKVMLDETNGEAIYVTDDVLSTKNVKKAAKENGKAIEDVDEANSKVEKYENKKSNAEEAETLATAKFNNAQQAYIEAKNNKDDAAALKALKERDAALEAQKKANKEVVKYNTKLEQAKTEKNNALEKYNTTSSLLTKAVKEETKLVKEQQELDLKKAELNSKWDTSGRPK